MVSSTMFATEAPQIPIPRFVLYDDPFAPELFSKVDP